MHIYRFIIALLAALSLSACSILRLPEPSLPQQTSTKTPEIKRDTLTGESYVEIDIMIYNVAGLPWPIREERTKALKLIGETLLHARERGFEPDVVMIQEGFRRGIRTLLKNSGYPNWVRGPTAQDKSPKFSERAPEHFIQEREFFNGEKIGKLMGSGLYILSNFPIHKKETQPFYAWECAGFDCGANKGVLWAEIEIPGMPGHLQVFTTHMQSREAAGVSHERSMIAYKLQFDALDEFVDTLWSKQHPMIFGGDFNSKNSRKRLNYISDKIARKPLKQSEAIVLTHYYCVKNPNICDTDLLSDGAEPWLDTQDWQGFSSGSNIKVVPIEIFDVPNDLMKEAPKINGKRTLSDHGAVWVRYRLSWHEEC